MLEQNKISFICYRSNQSKNQSLQKSTGNYLILSQIKPIITPIQYYNFKPVKKMPNYLLPICLFLWVSYIICIDIPLFTSPTILPTSTFYCIYQSNYSSILMTLNSRSDGFEPADARNVANALTGHLRTDVIFQPCRGRSVEKETQMLMSFVGGVFRTMWVVPGEVETLGEDCKWRPSQALTNCQYLQDLITQMKQYSISVGIYTSASSWTKYFGSQKACPQVASSMLFWDPEGEADDGRSDFGSYRGREIGGWVMPTMKRYGKGTVCGITMGINYRA